MHRDGTPLYAGFFSSIAPVQIRAQWRAIRDIKKTNSVPAASSVIPSPLEARVIVAARLRSYRQRIQDERIQVVVLLLLYTPPPRISYQSYFKPYNMHFDSTLARITAPPARPRVKVMAVRVYIRYAEVTLSSPHPLALAGRNIPS